MFFTHAHAHKNAHARTQKRTPALTNALTKSRARTHALTHTHTNAHALALKSAAARGKADKVANLEKQIQVRCCAKMIYCAVYIY